MSVQGSGRKFGAGLVLGAGDLGDVEDEGAGAADLVEGEVAS